MKSLFIAGLLILATPVLAAQGLNNTMPTLGKTIETSSGLSVRDLKEGQGETPQTGQTVVVNYTGWLQEGNQKFDRSLDRGEPFRFHIGRQEVIPGWDEGLSTMRVGGKRRLIVPPNLAYGSMGVPGAIPPNATLIFEVELLGIEP